MGEAKRNKARLGDWYGKKIVPGHPDCPPPNPKPSFWNDTVDMVHVNQTVVAEAPPSVRDKTDDIVQADQTLREEQTLEFLPAAENIEPRRQSSPAYHRVNRNAALTTMALLSLVGTIGAIPSQKDKS